jgi:predicted metalloprotease with PDZ domain
VATRGQWDFAEGSFEELTRRILRVERTFWRDPDTANYLITLLPSDDAPGNYGGTALEDSFALFMGTSAHLDFQTKFLLAHEMFHSWNSAKLGEIRGENPFWFTEGFTDYYARTLLLRAGLINAEEYAEDVRADYQEYLLSSVLHIKGKAMQDRFFSDTDVQRLAYLRGNFLALRCNSKIQVRSNGKQSLDDGMLDLLRRARSKEIVLSDDFLASHFAAYVGSGAMDDVQKYIEAGETIPWASEKAQSTGRSCPLIHCR